MIRTSTEQGLPLLRIRDAAATERGETLRSLADSDRETCTFASIPAGRSRFIVSNFAATIARCDSFICRRCKSGEMMRSSTVQGLPRTSVLQLLKTARLGRGYK